MVDKQQTILEKLQKLAPQNVQEVLNFVEFLEHKEKINQVESISFYESTQEFAGCLDGLPPDLSTNKKYLA